MIEAPTTQFRIGIDVRVEAWKAHQEICRECRSPRPCPSGSMMLRRAIAGSMPTPARKRRGRPRKGRDHTADRYTKPAWGRRR